MASTVSSVDIRPIGEDKAFLGFVASSKKSDNRNAAKCYQDDNGPAETPFYNVFE